VMPRLLSDELDVKYLAFEGKSDLEKSLANKMTRWVTPDTGFVILRDQDAGDCKVVREGLYSRAAQSSQPHFLVRVACRELESWILGDWTAISVAFGQPALAPPVPMSRETAPSGNLSADGRRMDPRPCPRHPQSQFMKSGPKPTDASRRSAPVALR